MKRAWVRSSLFNIFFFGVTAIFCFLYLPALLLPRKIFTGLVRLWIYIVTFFEYAVLGLSYEVRGREFLPQSGAYIIAAKHQSAYETIKLRVLFKDPAIILKKELLSIPLWGWYLKKSGVIAIDRGTPERALRSIEAGALKMTNEGRPIVIFLQGTRVRPDETPADKAYKPGVARIQDVTQLPIIPMALNSGLFWPKRGWLKSPGKVVFEFFAPIQLGQNRKELLKALEVKIEAETNKLMNEARATELTEKPSPVKKILAFIITFAIVFAGYSYLWKYTAEKVVTIYVAFLKDVVGTERIHADPVISGFPGPIKMTVAEDSIRSSDGTLKIENLVMTGWPIPFVPVHIATGPINVKSFKWSDALNFDSLDMWVTYWNDDLKIHDSSLKWQDFEAKAAGTIDLKQEPIPKFDMNVTLKNFAPFIGHLADLEILKKNQAMFMAAGLTMMSTNGEVTVPITQNGQTLYAGPLPVASLPAGDHPEPRSLPDPGQ